MGEIQCIVFFSFFFEGLALGQDWFCRTSKRSFRRKPSAESLSLRSDESELIMSSIRSNLNPCVAQFIVMVSMEWASEQLSSLVRCHRNSSITSLICVCSMPVHIQDLLIQLVQSSIRSQSKQIRFILQWYVKSLLLVGKLVSSPAVD